MKTSPIRLHTEPHTIERTWDADGIPVLTAAVSIPCPVPADTGVSRRIRRFYQLQGRSYLRYFDANGLERIFYNNYTGASAAYGGVNTSYADVYALLYGE